MRLWRRGIWMAAVLLTGAVLAVAVRNRDFTDTTRLTTVLGFLLSVTGLALGLLREGPPPGVSARTPADVLAQVADHLAAAVGEQWQSEWRLRRLQDPDPLRVEWSAAETWLADRGQNIGGEPADLLDAAAADDVVAVHARVPSQRLVVLGEPGSGKSVLALRFTLDTLNRRGPGEPVPVIFLPSTWQPDRETACPACPCVSAVPRTTAGGNVTSSLPPGRHGTLPNVSSTVGSSHPRAPTPGGRPGRSRTAWAAPPWERQSGVGAVTR